MKRINKILVLFLLVAITNSCDLERNPLDQFSKETFWTSAENAELALAGIYHAENIYNRPAFASDWWSYGGTIFLEFATDNAYDRRGINSGYHQMTSGNLLPNNRHVKEFWDVSYKKIARCNEFLQGIENLTDAEPQKVARMKAEVRFLRASQYFYLSQFFQDAPLVTKVLTSEEANTVPINTKAELVEFCFTEFDAAVKDLPRYAELTNSEIGRVCKQAVLAFMGRLYMSEKRWSEAAATYKQIIDYNENIIDPDYTSIFTPVNENSKEMIFSNQFTEDLAGMGLPQHAFPTKDGGWCIVCPLGDLCEAYQFTDGSDFSFDNPLYDPTDLTKNRDPRLAATLICDGTDFRGTQYICHPDSKSKDKVMGGQTTQTGFLLRKFFDESFAGNLGSYGGNIPIIRYAEVLLSYLESKLEAGDPITQALLDETVNKVRGRKSVQMPPITETNADKLRPILRNERRVELAMEGLRLWDLFRWHTVAEEINGDVWGAPFPGSIRKSKKDDPYGRWYVTERNFREQDYKWPIPQTEQDINPNLR